MGYLKPQSKTSRWSCFSALAAGGRPARSTANGQKIDRWSLGRPRPGTESRPLCRLTDPVDRGFPESRSSLAVDRSVDRPSSQSWRARLCTSVDRLGRPTRSTGRSQDRTNIGIEMLTFYLK